MSIFLANVFMRKWGFKTEIQKINKNYGIIQLELFYHSLRIIFMRIVL